MSIRLAPYPVKHAVAWVKRVHRKLPSLSHRMWAVGAWKGGALVGVAVVGPPQARMLASTRDTPKSDPQPMDCLEIVRVAVVEGQPNVCSALYGACSRAAKAMGCLSLLTYTGADEPGTSLRAAGFVRDPGVFGGGEASRPARPRNPRNDFAKGAKCRWWAPWSRRAPTNDGKGER